MKNYVQYKELNKFVNNMNKKFDKKNIDKFFTNTSHVLTKGLYDKLWKLTPVITGFLRHGWNVGLGMRYQNARFYPKNPILFPKKGQYYSAVKINIKKIKPDRSDNKYTVHFKNPVSYAPFVEYGHNMPTTRGRESRAKNGRAVKLFSRNEWVKPRIEGHGMTKKSVAYLNSRKDDIVREEFNKFLKE